MPNEIEDQANELEEKASKAKTKLQKISEKMATSSKPEKPKPIEYQTMITDELSGLIDEALEIISTYRDSGYEIETTTATKDLIKLAAIQVYLSKHVGYLHGMAIDLEARRRIEKSRLFTEVKSTAESLGVTATDKEADHLSRIMAEDDYTYAHEVGAASRVIYNFFTSLDRFTMLLNSSANRESRQSMIG